MKLCFDFTKVPLTDSVVVVVHFSNVLHVADKSHQRLFVLFGFLHESIDVLIRQGVLWQQVFESVHGGLLIIILNCNKMDNNKDKFDSNYSGIVITKNKQYSCCAKVFCCKCFSCCRKVDVLTSHTRKQTLQRLLEKYLIQTNDNELLYDPVKLMILIYVCDNDEIPKSHLSKCKISPTVSVSSYRTDLQFYIPQLCNYVVFYRNMEKSYLLIALEKMSKLNFYFAHLFYFYMKSIQKNVSKQEIHHIKPVIQYNHQFIKQIGKFYQTFKLNSIDLFLPNEIEEKKEPEGFIKRVIRDYQSSRFEFDEKQKVRPEQIELKTYKSLLLDENEEVESFYSTIGFFDDLFHISEDLKNYENKKQKVKEFLKVVNERLPANVYIPFSKYSFHLCNALKIVVDETRVFSTKERAPFCLCIEVFCPVQTFPIEKQEVFWTNIETPFTMKMTDFTHRGQYLSMNYEKTVINRNSRHEMPKGKRMSVSSEKMAIRNNVLLQEKKQRTKFTFYKQNKIKQVIFSNIKRTDTPNQAPSPIKNQSIKQNLLENEQSKSSSKTTKKKKQTELKKYNVKTSKNFEDAFDKMFGQSTAESKQRISRNSIFGKMESWDVFYIIIKTNDDLKQEQFAMQLIHQFDYIFKLENLPLLLTPYEVISMGPDRGIMEMVKDTVTFDTLKKTLKKEISMPMTLKEFFEFYFRQDIVAAKQNFLQSLAAYCLVMYFIQAKDRHNGNILLHRSGKIVHIDFGFLLSNMPGKGIELEKDCPFKLLSEYVEVLDGSDSYYFKKFRQYFFLGFKAVRKHQSKVVMLIKMMYSAGGMTMPCFEKGEEAIKAFEARIYPPNITTDLMLNSHCQKLINLSLDNWAAKWYDRFQYFAQGIFY